MKFDDMSKEERQEAGDLLSSIEWSFRSTPKPHEIVTMNDPKIYSECKRIQEDFGGISWMDISAKTIRRNPTSMNELTAEAFRYYIPAYMWWTLKNPEDMFFLTGSILFVLTPPPTTASVERQERYITRMNSFDSHEAAVTKSYLQHLDNYFSDDFIDELSPRVVLAGCPIFLY